MAFTPILMSLSFRRVNGQLLIGSGGIPLHSGVQTLGANNLVAILVSALLRLSPRGDPNPARTSL